MRFCVVNTNARCVGKRSSGSPCASTNAERNVALAGEGQALLWGDWAHGDGVTFRCRLLLWHDGRFPRTLMLHELVSKRSGAAAWSIEVTFTETLPTFSELTSM